MGCLRINKLNEYLADPLKRALKDIDPYVRKIAVLCVPKVYEVSTEIIE
jgi:vesicle coat complex subunit